MSRTAGISAPRLAGGTVAGAPRDRDVAAGGGSDATTGTKRAPAPGAGDGTSRAAASDWTRPRRNWEAEPLEIASFPGGGDPLNGELWFDEPKASEPAAPDREAPLSGAPRASSLVDSSADGGDQASSATASGGADAAPAPPTEPTARPAESPPWPMPVDEGPRRLPPEVIQYVVRSNAGRFRACYAAGLLHDRELQGRVVIRFVIGHDGVVSAAANAGSRLDDPDVVRCIVAAFQRLTFPPPNDADVVVTYPLHLLPRRPP